MRATLNAFLYRTGEQTDKVKIFQNIELKAVGIENPQMTLIWTADINPLFYSLVYASTSFQYPRTARLGNQ